MFNFVFKSRWYVQLVLALVAFAAAVFFYLDSQRFEASKAAARAAGMPAAVSLNDFDPARDVHPADEVHVTGWINPDYTYQLIEEHRRSSDTIRRMFVMFGPSDPVDARVARAVVLLEEADVDRFIEAVVAARAGIVGA